MYTVTDTIQYKNSWLYRYPELQQYYGEGLLVILDYQQIKDDPIISNRLVKVIKPDGQAIELNVTFSEKRSAVALFFSNLAQGEIPRGSQISW